MITRDSILYVNIKRITLIALVILLSACGQQTDENSRSVNTQSERPAIRILVLDNLQVTPEENAILPSPLPTTPRLTSTPTQLPPTFVPPTPIPSGPTQASCTNKAEFIKHQSVSDNSSIEGGVFFAKVWQVKNTGTCEWDPTYALVFVSGDEMNGPSQVFLSQNVKPGEIVDLSVPLAAPLAPNVYAGYWMLRDQYGNLFGVGASADQPITVQIVVPPPKKDKII